MKNHLRFLILILIFSPITIQAQLVGSFDTVITYMGEQRTLSLYVPANYDSTNNYRLMVGLHGLGDNSSNYRNALINSLNWDAVFPNTLFIFPDGGSDQNKDFYAPLGDEGIITESLNFVQKTYSIDTTDIILQGFSLGGRSAMKYGFDHPSIFTGLFLNTPAIQGWHDAINDTMAGVTYNYSNASKLPVYITIGEQDVLYAYILDNVKNLLKKNDIPISFHLISGLGHTVPSSQYTQPSMDFFNDPFGPDFDVDLFEIDSEQRTCNSEVQPTCFIQNNGAAQITSIEINYELGANSGTHIWNGVLDTFEHAAIQLPVITGDYGSQPLKLTVGAINGNKADTMPENNFMTDTIVFVEEGDSLNISEGFEGDMNGWITEDSKTLFVWYKDTDVKKTGQASIAAFNTILLFYTDGNVESFQSPVMDMTTAQNTELIFDIAFNYHKYTPPYVINDTAFADTLEIMVSTDCGATFQTIYKKGGADLATAESPILNPLDLSQVWFTPSSNEWRTDTIPMSAFDNEEEVIIRFSYISAMGGSIYLDNIRFKGDTTTGLNEIMKKRVARVFPNPATDQVQISIDNDKFKTLSIYDLSGKCVLQKNFSTTSVDTEIVNVSTLSNGFYHIVLEGKEDRYVEKFIIAN